MQRPGTNITCPNCRQPFAAQLEQIIDVQRDPQAKVRLLSGRTNLVTCPNCGYQLMLGAPLVYHDATKELLLVYVPMELSLPQRDQDKLIGSLSSAIMNSLPAEQRKGYLFQPRMMLTFQGLIETVLEADGITQEVLEGQRAKMRLVEELLQADPETLPTLIQQHDAEIDQEFFSMLSATAEAALANGQREIAEQTLSLRDQLLEQTSAGQTLLQRASQQEALIQEVAGALQGLGEGASYEDLIELALQMGFSEDGDAKLQILVGLARPSLDYQFFQGLTARIDQVDPADRPAAVALRDRLLDMTKVVDQQNEAIVRQATGVLNSIMNSVDVDAAINANLDVLDDTFLAVLSANIQNAEQKGDIAAAARLKMIFDKIVNVFQQNAPPAVRYINELMQFPSLEDAQASLEERADEFGPELVRWMDMLGQDLATRGNDQALERLGRLREEAAKVLELADGDGEEA